MMIPTYRWSRILMAGASALLLTGLCGCSDGEAKGKRGIPSYGVRSNSNYSSTRGSVPDTGMKLYGAGTGQTVIHANKRLVYSQVLSDKVANVNGINTAFVVLTETNAYAAILIDHTATGTRGREPAMRRTTRPPPSAGTTPTNSGATRTPACLPPEATATRRWRRRTTFPTA
ncbi:hypothetical protein N6H14_12550 [Paenibacillus sp. CC-CFT747]|nr:hypothetical protein N6H14_12550 [Paenibacillus sp. CC-CFT747]